MDLLSEYVGDSSYYKRLFKVAIPLALTILLESCMSIIDSIMVSSIGMVTAVGNAGNILQLNDGVKWGLTSGISIFAAQFYGGEQKDNMARTFGLALILMLINSLIWIGAVYFAGERILSFYLNDPQIVKYSLIYIRITILSLIPASINTAFSTMFRSMHNTKLPFVLSTCAALINVFLNYLFLFVLEIGIAGAAWGTLIAQVLLTLVYLYLYFRKKPWFYNPSITFDIHLYFVKPIFTVMMPLVINETFFGFGMSLFNKAYGLLGPKAMDGVYITNQIFNMFTFAIWGYGNAISVLVGSTLGKGKIEQAKKEAKYQLGSSFILASSLSLLMILFSRVYLQFFNITDPQVYVDAKNILYVYSFKIFLRTYTFMLFSTLKAGGDSKILNLFDSGFMYLIGLPLAFIGAYLGIKNIAVLILIVQIEQVVRLLFTLKRYNTYIWAKDLTKLVKE